MVGLSKAESSYRIHVNSLSTHTGEILASAKLPSAIKNGLTDFLLVSDNSHNIYIVWLQDKTIYYIQLSPSLKAQASAIKGASYSSITEVGLSRKGFFLAHKLDGTVQVMTLREAKEGLEIKRTFTKSVS